MSVGQTPPSGNRSGNKKATNPPSNKARSNRSAGDDARVSQPTRKQKSAAHTASSQGSSNDKQRSVKQGEARTASGGQQRSQKAGRKQLLNARDTFYESPSVPAERRVRSAEPQQSSIEEKRGEKDDEILPIGNATFYAPNFDPVDADIMPDGTLNNTNCP